MAALQKISEVAYVDKNMVVRAVERHGEFNFIHADSGIKVDFWVQGQDPYAVSKIERRKARNINGHKVYFVSLEDLILSKLLWYKESGSEQQLRDVQSVVFMQEKLDWRYLWKWSKRQETVRVLRELKAKVKRS